MSTIKPEAVNAWRYWQHPISGYRTPVFVRRISSRGTVYYIKPNPWTGRDARQGWTKEQTARTEDLVLGAEPTAAEIGLIEKAIGAPAKWERAAGSEGADAQ